MASVKIASLLLKTLAKPIANQLKTQAKNHEGFRTATISMAQFMHRNEMNMRVKLLGETHPKHIRPLNDAKAIDSGANFLSETFLFAFAAALIMAEGWRSRRAEGKRRDGVRELLEQHTEELQVLRESLEEERLNRENGLTRERELEKVVEEIVGIGLRGGWLVEPSPEWQQRWDKAQLSTTNATPIDKSSTEDVESVNETEQGQKDSATRLLSSKLAVKNVGTEADGNTIEDADEQNKLVPNTELVDGNTQSSRKMES